MAGSSIGKIFTVTTWGESHGPALGAVVEGCPAGLPLCEEDIQKYLAKMIMKNIEKIYDLNL